MSNSKTDILALAGVAGAGIAAAVLLRRCLRRDDAGAVPALRFPKESLLEWVFPAKALFRLGRDSFQYGTGRLVLEGCDPAVGVGTIGLLGLSYIVVRDPKLVEEVIKKNHQAGGGYGKSFRGDAFDPLIDTTFGRGLFFAEDQDADWAVAHRILTRPFSHRGILEMVPLMREQADKMIASLKRDSASGKAVHVYDYMVKMALETIAVCSMGTRFGAFDSEVPHPFPTAFQAVLDAMFDLLDVPRQLWSFCPRTMRKMKKAVGVMNEIIDDIVQKRLRKETCSLGKFPDLLDLMLDPGAGSKKLSEENIRSQILTFLFAGHDSTAAAMSSLIVFMVANPHVEAKLVEEIRQVVGDGEVQASHIPQLTYLDWCIKETLRLIPPAASFQRMAFDGGLLLGGRWSVPKMAPIIVDVFALHHDPETWGPDAASFVPERWESGPPHPASFMPFASGPRGCIGKEFSLMEQKIVAVKLFQNFSMRRVQGWTPRKGSALIKASEPMPHIRLGVDAEFNPQQFFVGASIPVELQERAPLTRGAQPAAMAGA
mmetsp:Transcript_72924/g.188079  ORF Transcript_72924/g.188079 Transcript_72924/m.188079 type:complete len:543 (-) Transcript_72924:257-1885(-)